MGQKRLIISAPFGNWFYFQDAISTLGTFTPEYRAGGLKRLWRVLSTVRYYPAVGAWVNKLGLPNPGIARGLTGCDQSTKLTSIISVSARDTEGWVYVLHNAAIFRPFGIELNVSCPNCKDTDYSVYQEVFEIAAKVPERYGREIRMIVKLPPVSYENYLEKALNAGLENFHCCNTIPTPAGGMSGKPLKPFSLRCCEVVKQAVRARSDKLGLQSPDSPTPFLIGGGGVTGWADVEDYLGVGCTHVSVASALFLPWKWPTIRQIAKKLTRI